MNPERIDASGGAGVPVKAEPIFYCYSLDALRAAHVAADSGCLREFCRAAFERNFLDGCGLGREADPRAVVEAVGLDTDDVLAEIRRPEVKEKLKAETEKAIQAGVFGVPTVRVDGELFWGDDRLIDAAKALKAEAPRSRPNWG